MSTTLVPPSLYAVRPSGRPAQVYETTAQAAAALLSIAPAAGVVYALTGGHPRSLSDVELRQVGRHLRARRLALAAANAVPATPTEVRAPQRRPVRRTRARRAHITTLKVMPLIDPRAVELGLAAGPCRPLRRSSLRG